MVSESQRRVRVAGFWRRASSGSVDAIVLAAVFIVLDVCVAVILRQPLPRLSQLGPDYLVDVAINGDLLADVGLALFGLLAFLYFFVFHALRGQTPGQALLNVFVIDAYGQRHSPLRALGRTAAYLPSWGLLALGILWIAFDREKRGLHDWLADTYVVLGARDGRTAHVAPEPVAQEGAAS
jgi:uncharacterized RDD family membrane protein YckC